MQENKLYNELAASPLKGLSKAHGYGRRSTVLEMQSHKLVDNRNQKDKMQTRGSRGSVAGMGAAPYKKTQTMMSDILEGDEESEVSPPFDLAKDKPSEKETNE